MAFFKNVYYEKLAHETDILEWQDVYVDIPPVSRRERPISPDSIQGSVVCTDENAAR